MNKKIIIIDDEQDVVEIVKTILKARDYQVISALNGEEGLRLINETKPDMIICDLMMPKMSGLEVCRRLNRDEKLKDIPVIVISAFGKESGKSEEFWRQGLNADDFINKPFDPLEFLGRIEYIFRKREYKSIQDSGNGMQRVAPSPKEAKPSDPHSARSTTDLKNAAPEEVVKIFIESWNNQRFQIEYSCLADEMLFGLSMEEYVNRRHQCYADTRGNAQIQTLKNVIESNIRLNIAKVICEKEVVTKGVSQISKEIYMLKKTQNGWKIVSVKINK